MFCLKFIILYTVIAININSIIIANGVAVNDDSSLYTGIDEVVELNEFNLHSSIYESEKSWVVQYYNKKDTRCLASRSVWITVAKELHMMRDVSVAAFNCFQIKLHSICLQNRINNFPSIRYYKPNSTNGSVGIEIEESPNDKILARAIINLMRKQQNVDVNTMHPYIQHTNLSVIYNATEKYAQHEVDSVTIFTYVIYVFIGVAILILFIWCTWVYIKRSPNGNLNVYTMLHKSVANDEDTVGI